MGAGVGEPLRHEPRRLASPPPPASSPPIVAKGRPLPPPPSRPPSAHATDRPWLPGEPRAAPAADATRGCRVRCDSHAPSTDDGGVMSNDADIGAEDVGASATTNTEPSTDTPRLLSRRLVLTRSSPACPQAGNGRTILPTGAGAAETGRGTRRCERALPTASDLRRAEGGEGRRREGVSSLTRLPAEGSPSASSAHAQTASMLAVAVETWRLDGLRRRRSLVTAPTTPAEAGFTVADAAVEPPLRPCLAASAGSWCR